MTHESWCNDADIINNNVNDNIDTKENDDAAENNIENKNSSKNNGNNVEVVGNNSG